MQNVIDLTKLPHEEDKVLFWNEGSWMRQRAEEKGIVSVDMQKVDSGVMWKTVVSADGLLVEGPITAINCQTGEIEYLINDPKLHVIWYTSKTFRAPLQLARFPTRYSCLTKDEPMLDIKGRLVEKAMDLKEPGDFMFTAGDQPACFIFVCPCNRSAPHLRSLPLVPNTITPNWELHGPKDSPTIKPAIIHESLCQWKGMITDGVFQQIEGC